MEDSHKKEEISTYHALRLGRQQKSRRKREILCDKGIFCFIGGKTPGRPFLKVLRSEYDRVWREVMDELRLKEKTQGLSLEQFDDLIRGKAERLTYERLAVQVHDVEDLEAHFEEKHGRRMTYQERKLYSRLLKSAENQPSASAARPEAQARSSRKFWLNEVVSQVQRNQKRQPDRLRQAWVALVGSEIAKESTLESVDTNKGIAICRCVNSARAFELRRRRDLPGKLAEALQMNVTRIFFR